MSIDGPDGTNARDAIQPLEDAIQTISGHRASLGVQQNILESNIRNLHNQIENLSAANSRIMDVDYAQEMSELASAQVLQQMGVAVLAQAIQAPSIALQLLNSIGRR